MTGQPYQRGNRDGLLNLAAELEAKAETQAADAERIRRSPGYRLGRQGVLRLMETAELRREVWSSAAALARRRAEACPEDPEVGE